MADERDEYTQQLDDVMGDLRDGGWIEGTDAGGQRWRLDDIVFTRSTIVPVRVELPTPRELPMTFTMTVDADPEWTRQLFDFFSPAGRARRQSEAAIRLFHRGPRWYLLKIAMRQAFLSAWYENTKRSW